MNVFLDMLFGKSSTYYSELYNDGLIDETFHYDYTQENGFGFLTVGGDTEKPDELAEKHSSAASESERNRSLLKKVWRERRRRRLGHSSVPSIPLSIIANQFTRYAFNEMDLFEVVPTLEALKYDDIQCSCGVHDRVKNDLQYVRSYQNHDVRGNWPLPAVPFLCKGGMAMKFALITGASGGIGTSTAKKLAREGWSLYFHYHPNEEAMTSFMEEIKGVEVIPVQADLTTSDGVRSLTEQIFELDAIVYCSGTSHWGLFQDHSEENMDEMISLHVKSPMLLVQALLPKLVRNRGSIVLMSSIWGQTGASCEVVYSAVKGAQLSFVKSLSKEVAFSGVRINAVAPGAVSTNMLSDFTEEDIQGIKDEIPMGRLAQPDQIADAVEFLLSPKAAYITGQTLSVNGGWYT